MQSEQMKRAAIYARTAVSQESFNNALARQIQQNQAYCQEHDYSVEEIHIYSEECSGIANYHNRPQFTALLDAAKRREFDVVVISAFDRLSRDHTQGIAIIDELQKHGITVESGEGTAELGVMKMEILAEVGKIERRKLAERSRYAKAAKRQGENC
jgi:site-specific DNA recombinase